MHTIRDVSRLANVSLSTVSKYFNHPDKLTPEYYERVSKAVQELNYYPNRMAQSMRTKKTNTIALLIPEINNQFFIEIYEAVYATCALRGYTPVIFTTDSSMEALEKLLNTLDKSRVDGMILSYVDIADCFPLLKTIESRMPFVLMSCAGYGGEYSAVLFDIFDGIQKATEHLIGRGHKRIAFLGGSENNRFIQERVDSYRACMEKHDLPVYDGYITYGKTSYSTGYHAAGQLVRLAQPPTAIVAANDIMATGCIKYLMNNGYSLPDDMAVTGFDGIQLSSVYHPSITTIVQPIEEMAVLSVEMLLQKLEKPRSKNRHAVFKGELEVRQSTNASVPFIMDI